MSAVVYTLMKMAITIIAETAGATAVVVVVVVLIVESLMEHIMRMMIMMMIIKKMTEMIFFPFSIGIAYSRKIKTNMFLLLLQLLRPQEATVLVSTCAHVLVD